MNFTSSLEFQTLEIKNENPNYITLGHSGKLKNELGIKICYELITECIGDEKDSKLGKMVACDVCFESSNFLHSSCKSRG